MNYTRCLFEDISLIPPWDKLEQEHIDFALTWTEKPTTPSTYLICYFLVFSPEQSKVLLVDHKKAELWLPPGGHVELDEYPKEAVIRKAKEELGIEAEFLFAEPVFVTVSNIVENVTQHTDVSLWYMLRGNPDNSIAYDEKEFIRWFEIEEIPFDKSDPHLKRFIEKMNCQYRSCINLEAYESSASDYADKVENLHPYPEAHRFLSMIPPQGKIIDIGCGTGRDAKKFSEKGYKVTGIDFSPRMIKIAKEKAPQAEFHVMDMRSLDFGPIFDGAWANASLLHIAKSNFLVVLGNIFTSLKSNGIFYIKLKRGSSEGFELDARYNNLKKFYSYHDERELKNLLLAAGFTILDLFFTEKESSYETHSYIDAFCRKSIMI